MAPLAAVERRRAELAASSVTSLFGGALAGIPGIQLAYIRSDRRRTLSWNYWWQAHYLDAVVDAALRDSAHRGAWLRTGRALRRGIWIRNAFHYPNAFYDDMAWLALANQRLGGLEVSMLGGLSRASRRANKALGAHLRSAHTPDLGGGVWWNRRRDFKNAPASAPAAIYFARTGELGRAHDLVEWMYAVLVDPQTGMIRDGVRRREAALVADVYTYNQGTVLAALLALGDERSLSRAADLVAAIAEHCGHDVVGLPVLRTHGGHDGGLFTGILVRYLARAARDPRLDEATRATAGQLVQATASALWEGREAVASHGAKVIVFPADPGVAAQAGGSAGESIELSTQLQAWTIFEAAYAVAALA